MLHFDNDDNKNNKAASVFIQILLSRISFLRLDMNAILPVLIFAISGCADVVSSSLDGRIIGGTATTIKDHPYQVSVRYQERHRCGGAVISPSYVLTAAHCTANRFPLLMSVRAGSDFYEKGGVIALVTKIYQHDYYNSDTFDYDISILKLSRSLSLSNSIRAINLPEQDEFVQVNTISTVTGWGHTKEDGEFSASLLQAQVKIVDQVSCAKAYSPTIDVTERMICAGYDAGGKDACQGDSGGPLVADGKLVGLVSWGRGCGRSGYPGVYVRVAAFRKWINSKVNV